MDLPPAHAGLARAVPGDSAALVATDDADAARRLARALKSLGVRDLTPCHSATQGRALARIFPFHLCVVDGALPDDGGAAFLAWLRRSGARPACDGPLVALVRHPTGPDVLALRDAGATAVLCKTLPPDELARRLRRALHDPRPLIAAPAYRGPDRRTRRLGPPPGHPGRRHDDRPARLGPSAGPNLAQAEIDLILTAAGPGAGGRAHA